MITDVLLVLAVGVLVVARLLLSPHRRCTRCRGQRFIIRTSLLGKKTRLVCPKCHGSGKHRRLGATVVHAWFWALAGEWLLQRKHTALAALLIARHELSKGK